MVTPPTRGWFKFSAHVSALVLDKITTLSFEMSPVGVKISWVPELIK